MGVTRGDRPRWWTRILAAPALLLIAANVGCGGGDAAPATTRSLPTSEAAAVAAVDDHEAIEAGRVSVEDAAELLEARAAVFIDVRAGAAYEASRIPGAVSLPLETLTEPLQGLSLNTPIVTYCT